MFADGGICRTSPHVLFFIRVNPWYPRLKISFQLSMSVVLAQPSCLPFRAQPLIERKDYPVPMLKEAIPHVAELSSSEKLLLLEELWDETRRPGTALYFNRCVDAAVSLITRMNTNGEANKLAPMLDASALLDAHP